MRKCVSLRGRKEITSSGSQPEGVGTIYGVPCALSSTMKWGRERFCSVVRTQLSFRKMGHVAIKLTLVKGIK